MARIKEWEELTIRDNFLFLGFCIYNIVCNDYHCGIRAHTHMSVIVFDLQRLSGEHIYQSLHMGLEVEVILIVAEIESNVYCLVTLNLLEKELLIGYHNAFVGTCPESGI